MNVRRPGKAKNLLGKASLRAEGDCPDYDHGIQGIIAGARNGVPAAGGCGNKRGADIWSGIFAAGKCLRGTRRAAIGGVNGIAARRRLGRVLQRLVGIKQQGQVNYAEDQRRKRQQDNGEFGRARPQFIPQKKSCLSHPSLIQACRVIGEVSELAMDTALKIGL